MPTSTPAVITPDRRAALRASRQYGLLTLTDALACGLSATQVRERTRYKGWCRVARGLYQLPGAPPRSWRGAAMAGCLLAGVDARASHLTATALHGFGPPTLLPHVTVPPGSSARTPLVRIHQSVVPAIDRAIIDGIPCTSASRALIESARLVDRSTFEELADQALCAGLASPESLLAALDRAQPRWQGAATIREVLSVWTDDIRPGSPAEVRFLRRLIEWGADGAVTQHVIEDAAGVFIARVDVALPERRQAFEYDSDLFHGPRRFEHDELRHARLAALGWRVDHVSKRDLLPSATRIPALLAAA